MLESRGAPRAHSCEDDADGNVLVGNKSEQEHARRAPSMLDLLSLWGVKAERALPWGRIAYGRALHSLVAPGRCICGYETSVGSSSAAGGLALEYAGLDVCHRYIALFCEVQRVQGCGWGGRLRAQWFACGCAWV